MQRDIYRLEETVLNVRIWQDNTNENNQHTPGCSLPGGKAEMCISRLIYGRAPEPKTVITYTPSKLFSRDNTKTAPQPSTPIQPMSAGVQPGTM